MYLKFSSRFNTCVPEARGMRWATRSLVLFVAPVLCCPELGLQTTSPEQSGPEDRFTPPLLGLLVCATYSVADFLNERLSSAGSLRFLGYTNLDDNRMIIP